MKKRFMVTVAMLALALSCKGNTVQAADKADRPFYEDLCAVEGIGSVQEIWTENLTTEVLENRGDTLLIEKCIGQCIDDEGNGVLFVDDEEYNYISYSSCEDVREGDVVLTLFIYNPGNSYTDDIIDRIDYVIDSATESN